jgi:hypothetical protein
VAELAEPVVLAVAGAAMALSTAPSLEAVVAVEAVVAMEAVAGPESSERSWAWSSSDPWDPRELPEKSSNSRQERW